MNELLSPPRSYKSAQPLETPFLRAKQQWDDRIGSSVVQAKNWRMAFFLSSLMSLTLLVACLYQVRERKIIPIIVGIDKERGEPVVIGPAGENSYKPQLQEIKYFLSQFITSVRSVPTDPVLIKHQWMRAYKFLRPEASNMLNDLTNKDENSPLKRIGEQTVIIKPISVTQVSETNSFQARWEEIIYEKQGSLKERYVMTGIFTIDLDPPRTEENLLVNPLGLFIKNFQWNREL